MSDSRNPIPNPEPLPTPNPPAAPVPPAGPYVQAAPNAPVNPPPSGAMGDPYSPPMFQYAPVPPKRKEPVDGKDSVFALVFFLFSMLWADFALLHGFRLGFTIATALFFVLMTAYLAVKGVRLRLYPLCCGLMAVAGSIPFAIYHDTLIELVSFAAIILLLALYGAQLSGCCRYSPGGFRCIADVANSVLISPGPFMGVSLRSLFSKTPPPESSDDSAEKPKKPTRKILLGVLCAVPVLAVIIPLLIRSDLYFEQLLSHFSLNIKDLVIRLLLGVLLFPFPFSLLFAWKEASSEREFPGILSSQRGRSRGDTVLFIGAFGGLPRLSHDPDSPIFSRPSGGFCRRALRKGSPNTPGGDFLKCAPSPPSISQFCFSPWCSCARKRDAFPALHKSWAPFCACLPFCSSERRCPKCFCTSIITARPGSASHHLLLHGVLGAGLPCSGNPAVEAEIPRYEDGRARFLRGRTDGQLLRNRRHHRAV